MEYYPLSPKLSITPAAMDLLESYKQTLNPSEHNLCISIYKKPTSFGVMSLQYYADVNLEGSVTYACSYEPGTDVFRTIWGSRQIDYAYYGFCEPEAIIWDIPNDEGNNHVFGLKFVPIHNYKHYDTIGDDYNLNQGIPVADIKSIDCILLEESYGHIAIVDPDSYNNVYSSKGLLAILTLNNGERLYCYLINNYDKTGTLIWKQ